MFKDAVESTIKSFIFDNVSFTSLDVSNEVKSIFQSVRHKDIRNHIREFNTFTFLTDNNYSKTEIDVTLQDGSTSKAWLYHPSDCVDLDSAYSSEKRSQVSKVPSAGNAGADTWGGMFTGFSLF